MISAKEVVLKKVSEPFVRLPLKEPAIPDQVYAERLRKTLDAMKKRELKYLIIYADREHYSNFDYLTGFDPRFEEGILLLRDDGDAVIFLGNECFCMHQSSRIPVKGVLYQALSLPNQPIDQLKNLEDMLREAGLSEGNRIGMAGWKLMYPYYGDDKMFDVPSFIVNATVSVAGEEYVVNATDLFIHPDYGVRTIHTAEEIATLEFGASHASDAVLNIIRNMQTGMTELELSKWMGSGGLPVSCYPMLSSGSRTKLGLVSPSSKKIELGDAINCSQGLRGGLTCRAGYAAYTDADLPEDAKDYIEKLAAPYFATVMNWFEVLKIGIRGGDIYDMVQSGFPKEVYGWVINPGHLIDTEEWSASPIYKGSDITIKSGMCMQMDIIPSMDGYAGANCEDGVVIADDNLRKEIRENYPEMFDRMQQRRTFLTEVIGIQLAEEILPMSNSIGLCRPYMLNKDMALAIER